MITHVLIAELKAISDALALTNAEFAKLNTYAAQTGQTRQSPALTFKVEAEKIYGGKRGVLKVSLILESTAGDDAAPDPDNHLSRYTLVRSLFLDQKAERFAALAARGKVTVDDWGQIPGVLDTMSEGGGADRLRSVLILRAAARLTPPAG